MLKKAEAGDPVAQLRLGAMYRQGEGTAKDAAKAVAWFRKAAEQGLAEAQYSLGAMYRRGEGITKNDAQAVAWYTKAAAQGYVHAQFTLGVMYQFGDGVREDAAQAVAWYTKAAEQGDAGAQESLGGMYHGGEGVAKDDAQAVAWFRKAAEQGNAHAQTSLGRMYANGEGMPKDDAQAVAWFRKAAEQGNAHAQTSLGVMYTNGEGVPRDLVRAYAWYGLAAAQGEENAQEYRDRVEGELTLAQRAEGQRLASGWTPGDSTLLEKTDPQTVTAHILDPIKGYMAQQWVVGRDVFPPRETNLAAQKDIYVINVYEAGKVKPTICQESTWLLAKSTYTAMDDVAAKAKSKTEAMIKNFDQQNIVRKGNKSAPLLRNMERWKMGFLKMWKVTGIITNAAKLSKPTYDLGRGIGSAGSPSDFAYMLDRKMEIEAKAQYSDVALKFFAMKAKHDKFISQKNNSYHDDTVAFLVMCTAYTMGHDNIPFDWQKVRKFSEEIYTGLEGNLDEYITHNVPLIEQIRTEMSQFSAACSPA